ncbi:hypothetical protein RclHR1_16000002 [Rhizophagus clarus]|uniref:Uncharacterized protein n=1 Tax=Rhizophagus clarus TaxID=94130 RepID=A0A2Z6QGQ2_9GLOM|nr:hypothetical protein RclHR1_16000002 [Rhizophagus clarus]
MIIRYISQSAYNSHSRRDNQSNVRISNNELLRYYPLKKGQALTRVKAFKKSSDILMRVKDNGFIEYYCRSNNKEISGLPCSIFKPTKSRLRIRGNLTLSTPSPPPTRRSSTVLTIPPTMETLERDVRCLTNNKTNLHLKLFSLPIIIVVILVKLK